jgi:hypothetical protein
MKGVSAALHAVPCGASRFILEKPMDHHTTTYKAIKPDDYGFILTSIAEDCLKSIAMVKRAQGCAITLISGAPGSGKTQALEAHCRVDENALLVTAVSGEDRPLDVSATLL